MKILISGSTGFIGTYLHDHLKKGGHEIIGLSQKGKYKWNLLDNDTPDYLEKDFFDVLIHLASFAHERRDTKKVYDQNIKMTRNLVNSIKNKCKFIIFFSSTSVYNEASFKEDIKCTDLAIPYTFYGKSKLHDELIIQELGIPYAIIRLCPTISGIGKRDMRKRIYLPFLNISFTTKNQRSYNFATLESIGLMIDDILIRDYQRNSIRNHHDGKIYGQDDLLNILNIQRVKVVIRQPILSFIRIAISLIPFKQNRIKLKAYYHKLFESNTFNNNVHYVK